jgi:hypothetical protein
MIRDLPSSSSKKEVGERKRWQNRTRTLADGSYYEEDKNLDEYEEWYKKKGR